MCDEPARRPFGGRPAPRRLPQLASEQLAAALASYHQIGEDSVYHSSAQQAIEKARRHFVARTGTHAQRLAAQHRCAELQRLAIEAGNVVPEAKVAGNLPCTDAVAPPAPAHSGQAIEGGKAAPSGGSNVGTPVATANDIPDSLDRAMLSEGVAKVKSLVLSCRDKSPAKGQVNVSVKVGPDGYVSSVTVKNTPDDGLGNCVAGRMQKATFAKTQTGGSFSYPFTF